MPYRPLFTVLPGIVLLCWGGALAAATGDAPLAADKATMVTLDKEELPLQEVLQALSKTGMRVEDRRREKTNPPMKLGFKKATFWEAVDAVAAQANLGLYLYHADGIALVPGPYRKVPLSYHGPFRNSLQRIAITADLETGKRFCDVTVEIAWEPRLQPFLVGVGPHSVKFGEDAMGKQVTEDLPEGGREWVVGKPALRVPLRLPAPPRSVAMLEELKGSFLVVAPSEMLTFTFDNLKPIKPMATPRQDKKKGVSIGITEIMVQKDRWVFEVTIDHPPGGAKFESHRLTPVSSWLKNNSIVLEKKVGKVTHRLVPTEDDEEVEEPLTSTHGRVRYHFKTANNAVPFGDLGAWTLVLRTPGCMVEVNVPYHFKGVPLP